MINRIPWVSGTLVPNPAANTVMVQTGALTPGVVSINCFCYCESVAVFAIQLIDTDGSTVLQSQRFSTSMATIERMRDMCVMVTQQGQKVRIIATDAIVGNVQCSLF